MMKYRSLEILERLAAAMLSAALLFCSELAIAGDAANQAASRDPCTSLDCLLCPALADDAPYAEGVMKAMKHIVPGKDHWLFRSEFDLSNEFGIPEEMVPEFRRLIAAFHGIGIQVAMVVQPTRGLMHADKVIEDYRSGFDPTLAGKNFRHFLKQLRQAGAIVPDMARLLDAPLEKEYFFRRDHHWTPFGSRMTADIVVETLLADPVYESLPEKAFITEEITKLPKDGTMNRALREVCGNNYGFQYAQGYQTIPADKGADALFGDVGDPEIVLIGTSNSANRDEIFKNYNFDGFLKAGLSADILNYALPGAGQEGSLLGYLLSEDYDPETPPKLIIWEHPVSWRLEDPLMYRQLMPALAGGCSKRRALVEAQSGILTAGDAGQRLELFANAGRTQKDLSQQKAFMELDFGDQPIGDFYVITYYDNGARDKVWFRRSSAVASGKYLLELSRDASVRGANLLSVFIEPSDPVDTETNVEFQLCVS